MADQLMKEVRFPFEETFGVKGIGKMEKFIVQVVSQFMEQGSQEGLEGDYLLPLGRAHPDGDPVGLPRFVEALKLSPRGGRAPFQDDDLEGPDPQGANDRGDQGLRLPLGLPVVTAFESVRQCRYQGKKGLEFRKGDG